MNDELLKFARNYLIENLEKLPEKNQRFFKQLYSGGNLELSIPDVVEKIPAEKLDWAMQQVKNTLRNKNEKN